MEYTLPLQTITDAWMKALKDSDSAKIGPVIDAPSHRIAAPARRCGYALCRVQKRALVFS